MHFCSHKSYPNKMLSYGFLYLLNQRQIEVKYVILAQYLLKKTIQLHFILILFYTTKNACYLLKSNRHPPHTKNKSKKKKFNSPVNVKQIRPACVRNSDEALNWQSPTEMPKNQSDFGFMNRIRSFIWNTLYSFVLYNQ